MRLNEYTKQLWKERGQEVLSKNAENEIDIVNSGSLSSPFEGPYEEIKIVQEYMNSKNLMKIAEALPAKKKALYLKGFLKERRNQQVEIYYRIDKEAKWLAGRILVIGRDFVSINVNGERYWVTYHSIEVARVPAGFPDTDYSHTNIIYDNGLKQSLLLNFGEVVSEKETLKQLFYEETLKTNLETWQGTNVTVWFDNSNFAGKLFVGGKGGHIAVQGRKEQIEIPVGLISVVKTRNTMALIKDFFRKK